jgi:uncharacterized protein (TIGR00369 family)
LEVTVDDIVTGMPYARFLGIETGEDVTGLTTRMAFREQLVGNQRLPAIHGGVVGAFLEMAAIMEVIHQTRGERIPRPINFNVNYLRTAGPSDCVARAEVVKLGKRVAHVRVVGWQDDPSRPFASGYGNFLV